VTANLVLAPIADFVFPPVGVANVLLLVMLSARHLLPAYRALANRRFNLDTLYICIGAATVLSYTFFGMALMVWLLEFWPRLLKRLRRESERKLLARYRRRPRKTWLDRDGTTVEADLYELPSGQTVILRARDTVPADGTVIDGIAEIRESWLTGAPGLVQKEPGDKLYAASQVTHGEVNFRIESVPGDTMADRLAAYYKQAFNQPRNYPSAERFADSFVLPALVIGTAALGRGGLLMTQAVIRPDYVTGPTIAEEVGALTTMIQAAEVGILIPNPSALEALVDADCWVFDDSVSWHFHGARDEKFVETVNDRGRRDTVYLSSAGQGDAARVAEKFGFSWFRGGCTTTAKKEFIAQRQYDGQSVVYFGNCIGEAEAAEKADLAVNVCEGESGVQANVPIVFLNPDLAKCRLLLSLGVARMSDLRSTQATVTVPNIAAILAAIYLNAPVLISVLLTTLGTAVSYRHWTRILRSLE
jgi:cation transport ATPase